MTISNKCTGFTLIELMVTIGILATVAAIALPAYKGYISTAKQSECLNEVATINLAQEEYFLEFNSYFSGSRDNSDPDNLEDASDGYYRGEYVSTDNCTYSVVAGPSGIATSYVLTATGTNDLSGTIKTFTK